MPWCSKLDMDGWMRVSYRCGCRGNHTNWNTDCESQSWQPYSRSRPGPQWTYALRDWEWTPAQQDGAKLGPTKQPQWREVGTG